MAYTHYAIQRDRFEPKSNADGFFASYIIPFADLEYGNDEVTTCCLSKRPVNVLVDLTPPNLTLLEERNVRSRKATTLALSLSPTITTLESVSLYPHTTQVTLGSALFPLLLLLHSGLRPSILFPSVWRYQNG